MKRICVVTATRAEYGVLRNLIKIISDDDELELCLIVTGTHLESKYGMTVSEIESDGYEITEKVKILNSENGDRSIAVLMADYLREFDRVFRKYIPDIVVVVGDRYELIPIASAAMVNQIPIAHISGGETTEGAIDEYIRHSITKMSYIHFPACELYKKRIIQMGEEPDRVFNVGDIGVENIKKTDFMSKVDIEKSLGISLGNVYYCVTYHPVTQEPLEMKKQLDNVLTAIAHISENAVFVFTKANADSGGDYINQVLEKFVTDNKNCYLFDSLGSRRYLSLLKYSNGIVGNSSSGIIEAPSLGIPTINIGNRQRGRLQAKSIVNCAPEKNSIIEAFDTIASEKFQSSLKNIVNPYDGDNSAEQIVYYIKKAFVDGIDLEKSFYDVDFDK